MKSVQIENSFFQDKIALRVNHLPKKEAVKVLDCFSADGLIWQEVKKRSKAKIQVLRIEKEKGKKGVYLPGDNLKYLSTLDLSAFDVIDLDAFGVPFEQLRILFDRKFSGSVFVTFIQSMFGQLPIAMLEECGFTRRMVEKVPSLFSRSGRDHLLAYLSRHGVDLVQIISISRKHYLHFLASVA